MQPLVLGERAPVARVGAGADEALLEQRRPGRGARRTPGRPRRPRTARPRWSPRARGRRGRARSNSVVESVRSSSVESVVIAGSSGRRAGRGRGRVERAPGARRRSARSRRGARRGSARALASAGSSRSAARWSSPKISTGRRSDGLERVEHLAEGGGRVQRAQRLVEPWRSTVMDGPPWAISARGPGFKQWVSASGAAAGRAAGSGQDQPRAQQRSPGGPVVETSHHQSLLLMLLSCCVLGRGASVLRVSLSQDPSRGRMINVAVSVLLFAEVQSADMSSGSCTLRRGQGCSSCTGHRHEGCW